MSFGKLCMSYVSFPEPDKIDFSCKLHDNSGYSCKTAFSCKAGRVGFAR